MNWDAVIVDLDNEIMLSSIKLQPICTKKRVTKIITHIQLLFPFMKRPNKKESDQFETNVNRHYFYYMIIYAGIVTNL